MGRKGNAPCTVEGCDGVELAREWCSKHYYRWKRNGSPEKARYRSPDSLKGVTCSVEGCDKPAHSGGFCPAHYQRNRIYGDPLGQSPPEASQDSRRPPQGSCRGRSWRHAEP